MASPCVWVCLVHRLQHTRPHASMFIKCFVHEEGSGHRQKMFISELYFDMVYLLARSIMGVIPLPAVRRKCFMGNVSPGGVIVFSGFLEFLVVLFCVHDMFVHDMFSLMEAHRCM